MKILIVEDDARFALLEIAVLQKAGWKAYLVPSAEESLRAELVTFDAIVLGEIQPGKWTASLRYKSVLIRLVASGRFPDCVALLHRLRVDFPDTAVASFELTGEPSNPDTPAKFEINLVWYATARHQTTRTYERSPAEFAYAGRKSYN